jgi:hypothetical protein
MQIIALFHYLRFIIYKSLLSNMRNDLKGRPGENFVEHKDGTKGLYDKG